MDRQKASHNAWDACNSNRHSCTLCTRIVAVHIAVKVCKGKGETDRERGWRKKERKREGDRGKE